ncbi:9881_t:CDS:2, partial [Funneliformis geosporum]
SGILRKACEKRFEAHLLASISSAIVTLSGVTQVNNKQAAEILAKSNDERMPPLEVDYDPSSSKDGYTTDSDSSSPKDNYIIDSDSEKSSQVSIAMKNEINCIYRKMETRSKWHLSIGKCVEDALFDFGMAADYEHLAHSFIINLDDETYNSIFTEEELNEIRTYNSKELPEVPDYLLEYLLKYEKDSLEELREVLTEKESWEGRNYDKSNHFNFEWIKRSMHNLKNKREYRCSEAGRYFKGINDTKILKERGLKCPKILKDIFVDLGNAVRWEAETVRQMEVISWIHAAEEAGQFGENLEFFTLVLKAKSIIKKTISLVE